MYVTGRSRQHTDRCDWIGVTDRRDRPDRSIGPDRCIGTERC